MSASPGGGSSAFSGPTEYDLNGIGLDLHLTPGDQTAYDTFHANLPYTFSAVNELKYVKRKFRPHDDSDPSYIDINSVRYTVLNHISEGTFGRLCRVTDGTTEYALKEQRCMDMDNVIAVTNEILCQHIVSQNTYKGTPLAPKIISTYFDTTSLTVFMVMELMGKTVGNYFISEATLPQWFRYVLDTLADYLGYLQSTLRFTHGDLKHDNVMFDSTNTMRMIDFGFTRLEHPVLIESNELNTTCSPCKDILQFVCRFGDCYSLDPDLLNFVDTITEYTSSPESISSQFTNGTLPGVNDLGDFYMYLNTLDCSGCTMATPAGLKSYIASLTPLPAIQFGGKRARKSRRRKSRRRRTQRGGRMPSQTLQAKFASVPTPYSKVAPSMSLQVDPDLQYLSAEHLCNAIGQLSLPEDTKTAYIMTILGSDLRQKHFAEFIANPNAVLRLTTNPLTAQLRSRFNLCKEVYYSITDESEALRFLTYILFVSGDNASIAAFAANYRNLRPDARELITAPNWNNPVI